MYQVTKKLVSPDSSVEIPLWATAADPAHLAHFRTNYEETSKHLFRYADGTDNPLERLVHIMWDSKESYDEFMADTVMQETRAAHASLLTSLGITSEDIDFQEL
jgi:hypothetical protein